MFVRKPTTQLEEKRMWPKAYRDYPEDTSLVKNQVETGRGIIGCEMHELNGWGATYHTRREKRRKKGLIRTLLEELAGRMAAQQR